MLTSRNRTLDPNTPELTTEEALDPRDAGKFLGGSKKPVPTGTLANWRSRGDGPAFIRIGHNIRYLTSDLIAFREANRIDHGKAR